MKLFKGLFLVVGLVVLSANLATAQSALAVRCPSSAKNLKLFKQALEAKVLASIDTQRFTEPRVKVTLKKVSLDSATSNPTPDDVLQGSTVIPADFPRGLAFGVGGQLDYSAGCTYTYVVNVRSSAKENSSLKSVVSNTQSLITVVSTNR